MADKDKKKKKKDPEGTEPETSVTTSTTVPTTTLMVEGKEYDLKLNPPTDSKIVADAKSYVTEGLALGNMMGDLKATSDLLFVASCGVAGAINHPELPAKVSSIRFALLQALSDTDTALNAVNLEARDVVVDLRDGYSYLYESPPREDLTVEYLTACGEKAKRMAEAVGALATTYRNVATSAQGALETTLTEQGLEEKARRNAEDRQRDIKTSEEGAKARRIAIADQQKKLQGLIDEAKEAQNKAEDRAFAMAIVGSITSTVSSGVQAFVAAKTAPATAAMGAVAGLSSYLPANSVAGYTLPLGSGPTLPPGSGPTLPPGSGPTLPPGSGPTLPPGGGPTLPPGGGPTLPPGGGPTLPPGGGPTLPPGGGPTQPPGGGPTQPPGGGPTQPPGGGPTQPPGGGPTSPSNTTANTTAGINPGTAAAISAAAAAANARATESSIQAASAQDATAARYAQEKRIYITLLMELQTEEKNVLGAIAEYAEQMKNMNVAEKTAETAVNCLQQAVRALSKISTILEDCKHTWELMAQACQHLADSNVSKRITDQKNMKVKDRITLYMRPDFKERLLQLAARWFALHLVAKDLRTQILQVRAEHQKSINKAPSIEEARRLAPALGAKLKLDVDAEILRLDGTIALLKGAQDAT